MMLAGTASIPLTKANAQAVTITTSADSHGRAFFGEGVLQVVVTNPDADDDDTQESIDVEIDADAESGPDPTGTFTVFETSDDSGRFEFYLVHDLADDIAVAALDTLNNNGAAEHEALSAPPVAEASVIRFGSGDELPVTTALFEDVSFDILVGNTQITVDYEESSGVLELDRVTYGSDSIVYMTINDQDANRNPTASDSFTASASDLNGIIFDIEGASFVDLVMFEETGDNTAQFEATLQLTDVGAGGPDELEFTDEAVEVTLNDRADYDAPAAVPPNDSTDTSSKSFDIDDVDGELDEVATLTFASELTLTLRDNDQNKDSQDDETLDDAVIVVLDTAGGDVEFLDMEETDDNTGVFIIDLSNNELPITFLTDGESPTLNNSRLELRQPDIIEDIVIEYIDSRNDDSLPGNVTSSFTLEMTLAAGIIDLPDSAAVDDQFILTVTDANLNDNARAKDSYIIMLDGGGPHPLIRGGQPLSDIATFEIEIEGDVLDFDTPILYTLSETGISSGIFSAELDMGELISSAAIDVDDGDKLEIVFSDLTDAIAHESSDSLMIGESQQPEEPLFCGKPILHYNVIDGTAGDDTLMGTTHADLIRGFAGNDIIEGSGGNDCIKGGSGNDILKGNDGDDSLRGGLGDDRLEGGAGNDRISGGKGNDNLSGSAGNDRIFGGAGDDTLKGGDGDDQLYGHEGVDNLDGGAGNNILVEG